MRRVLGSGEFVERIIEEADERIKYALSLDQRSKQGKDYIRRICEENDVSVEELRMGSRRRHICELRRRIARHLVTHFGLPLAWFSTDIDHPNTQLSTILGLAVLRIESS